MANSNPTMEQMQAAQKQMMDTFMENYHKMVESFMPEDNPARTAGEMSMEYFNRMREIMEPMMTTMPESPQELMDHMMSFMKKSSDLNMEFGNKYMHIYQDMMGQWPMNMMGGEKSEPKKTTKKAAPKKAATDKE